MHTSLCEPANDISQIYEDMMYLYMTPVEFPKYLEEFSSSRIRIVAGPNLLICTGPTQDYFHMFIESKEHCHYFILPMLLPFSFLSVDRLAEHVLLEVSSR